MKVLCSPAHGALRYIMRGWQEVFEALDFEWHWWHPQQPAFDAFDEFEPDIVFLTNETCHRATMKCLKERPDTKVAIKVGNSGSLDKELGQYHETLDIPKNQYPVHIASEEEKRWIEDLDEAIGKPDFVYSLYHPNRHSDTMSGWEDVVGERRVRGLMPAACLFHDKMIKPNRDLSSDICFAGGYWPYKAVNLDKYILPLCHPVGKYNIKIFGASDWPVPQWLGRANDRTTNAALCSALICPNVSEPHANEFGFEVNERVFKLAAMGAFCISDYIKSLEEDIFPNRDMILANGPDHMHDMIDLYLANPQLCATHQESAYATVMKHHTYYNRVADVLHGLGLHDEAKLCLDKKEEHLEERANELYPVIA